MRKKAWLVVVILVVVVAGSALGAMSAFAQEPTVPDGSWWNIQGHCPGMSGDWSMGGYGVGDPVTLQRVAGTLGLTYDELTARLAQGETIAQVAEAQGVNSSPVVATILAPEGEILQVRVRYGYLTEAQAQAILEQARYWVEQTIVTPHYGYYGPATTPTRGYTQPYAPNYGWRSWGGGSGGMMGGGMMGGGMMGRGMMGGW